MATWKKYLIGEWNWKRPIKSILFIYGFMLLFSYGCSNRMIFQPPTPGYSLSSRHFQQTTSSEGERIAMYHLPAAEGMPTLLWAHGNAEDIGYLRKRVAKFHDQGFGILSYDYPGYGHSEGKPSEQGCYQAAEAAWQHLTGELKVPAEKIIVYGQSVGSGSATWLAEKHDAGGLVLVAPFVSAYRTMTRVPIFPGDKFKNIKRIPNIKEPLLVIHGTEDGIIAPWHGEKLHALHDGPKKWLPIEGAGHNDIYILAGDEIISAVKQFAKKHIVSKD